jgi:predicted DNA-binding transcriptional regulator AlpA
MSTASTGRSKFERSRPQSRGNTPNDDLPPTLSLPLGGEGVRLLSKAEVVDRVGRSFPTLWQWMQENKFPRARDVHGRPMWIEREIEHWIRTLPIKRIKGDQP